MGSGRPPKSAEQHIFEGTDRTNRLTSSAESLQAIGRPIRPLWFSDYPECCEAWNDILRSAPWLTESDSETVERMAFCLSGWRGFAKCGVPDDYRDVCKMQMLGKTFDQLAGKCGLNPADRQRLRAQNAKQKAKKERFFDN